MVAQVGPAVHGVVQQRHVAPHPDPGCQQLLVLMSCDTQAAHGIQQQPHFHPARRRPAQGLDDALGLIILPQQEGSHAQLLPCLVDQVDDGLQRLFTLGLKAHLSAHGRRRHAHRGQQFARPDIDGCPFGLRNAAQRVAGRIKAARCALPRSQQFAGTEHQKDRQAHVGEGHQQQHPGQGCRRRTTLVADARDTDIDQQAEQNDDGVGAEQQGRLLEDGSPSTLSEPWPRRAQSPRRAGFARQWKCGLVVSAPSGICTCTSSPLRSG